MIKEIWKYAGIAALMVSLSACDDDDNGNDDPQNGLEPGEIEFSVSGDVNAEYTGSGIYADIDESAEERFFALVLTSDTGDNMTLVFAVGGNYPGDGTYSIQDINFDPEGGFDGELDEPTNQWLTNLDEFVAYGSRQEGAQSQQVIVSKSGDITIEIDGQNLLVGEFDISASAYEYDQVEMTFEELSVEISGSFNALRGAYQQTGSIMPSGF